ncbi:iron-containing alcohol dehydrogenase [Eleftheria terrae]|uniref:iron-containing alcohol dehydrogenase n=1 Tax=Eleftheria terrae TaxID=1597781 RepID=UPI00263B673F|nr:iron-containing alcohol dehydrogenase [Eleftheria terrae]WKB51021.1 iron-containing alcohol dehydrogenase [Eleftheria terrae]
MAVLNYLTTTYFDHGALAGIGRALARAGMRRPLVVSGPSLARGPILAALKAVWPAELPWVLFSEVPANPTEDAVMDALRLYQAEDCDGVVCLGGGSPMDLGKAVALLARLPPPLTQYAMTEPQGRARIREVAPIVAIPTTAGTGSEVSVATVIICRDGRKHSFVSELLVPRVAICDPDLTLGLPPGLTAATGMDAVTHCIEAVLSPVVNPPAEAVGLDGLERAIGQGHLLRAVADGQDREARWHMMMASTEGAMAFVKGLGAVHAMSHAVARLDGLSPHHGTLNAVILPAVLRFNEGHVGAKYDRLRRAMGLAPGADLAAFFEALNRQLGLPGSLTAMGVGPQHLDELVAHSVIDGNTSTAPRRPSADDYRGLFAALLDGASA